jgi:hypothetical protein
MRIMNAYLDRLTTAARTDAVLARKFVMVAGFVDRPESLFRPSVVWRVLRGRHAAPSSSADGIRTARAALPAQAR